MILSPTYDAVLTLEEVLKWKFQSEGLLILPFSRKIRIPDDRNTPGEAGINTSVKRNTTQHQQAQSNIE